MLECINEITYFIRLRCYYEFIDDFADDYLDDSGDSVSSHSCSSCSCKGSEVSAALIASRKGRYTKKKVGKINIILIIIMLLIATDSI